MKKFVTIQIPRPAKYPYKYEFVGKQHDIHIVLHNPKDWQVGDRVQAFMIMNDMSQSEFARLATSVGGTSVTQADIRRYINHMCQPKIDKLLAIAKAMGKPVEWVCGYRLSADLKVVA